MDPQTLSYPLAYEKIAQLFDSPNAPDLVVNPKAYQYARQPGQHGAADVVQARAPLVFSGPGIKRQRRHRHALRAGGHRADDRQATGHAADRRDGLDRAHVERARRRAGRLPPAAGRQADRRDHRRVGAAARPRVHLPARRPQQHGTEGAPGARPRVDPQPDPDDRARADVPATARSSTSRASPGPATTRSAPAPGAATTTS